MLIQVLIRASKDIAQFLPFLFTQEYNIAISTKKRNNNYSKLLYTLFIIASLHNTDNILRILYFEKIHYERTIKFMDNNRIKSIKKQTSNRFLNLYEAEALHRDGRISPYFIASRASQIEDLKISTKENTPDGVVMYAVHGNKKDKVVLIRQFRYPINDYIYEFPAGLVEPGEKMEECAVREMYEETGLHFEPLTVSNAYTKPFFTTVGMTDESCGMIFGYCDGTPTNSHQEAGEDIQIILADREECKRILKEEKVAIMCAYMLMHFIHSTDNDPLAFLNEIE